MMLSVFDKGRHGPNRRSFFALIAVIVALGGCGSNIMSGRTRADPTQVDAANIVLLNDFLKHPDPACVKRPVVSAEVVRAQVKRWTLDRCGHLVRYLVTFTPDWRGRTRIEVKEED